MENETNTKTRAQLLAELNKCDEFELALQKAREIKDEHDINLMAYCKFIDLMREVSMKSYRQGVESSKLIYGVGEYEKMKF